MRDLDLILTKGRSTINARDRLLKPERHVLVTAPEGRHSYSNESNQEKAPLGAASTRVCRPDGALPIYVFAATKMPLLRSCGNAFSQRLESSFMARAEGRCVNATQSAWKRRRRSYLENRARKNCRGWALVLKSNGGNWPSGAVFV